LKCLQFIKFVFKRIWTSSETTERSYTHQVIKEIDIEFDGPPKSISHQKTLEGKMEEIINNINNINSNNNTPPKNRNG